MDLVEERLPVTHLKAKEYLKQRNLKKEKFTGKRIQVCVPLKEVHEHEAGYDDVLYLNSPNSRLPEMRIWVACMAWRQSQMQKLRSRGISFL